MSRYERLEFTALLASDPEGYAFHQVKITYVGAQYRPNPTLVFHSFRQPAAMEHFVAFQRRDYPYNNDKIMPWDFSVRPVEMGEFVERVGTFPSLRHATSDSRDVSFCLTIIRTLDNEHIAGFECLVDRTATIDLTASVEAFDDPLEALRHEMLTVWQSMMMRR